MSDKNLEDKSLESPASPVGFDKRFVLTAILIGFVYAVIVAIAVALFGKEIAAVVGTTLSAVVVALVRGFEKLRFQTIPDTEQQVLSFPRIRVTYLLLFGFAFSGLQFIIGSYAGLLTRVAGIVTDDAGDFARFLSTDRGVAYTIIINIIAFFTGGLIIGLCTSANKYLYSFACSILAMMFNSAPVIYAIFASQELLAVLKSALGVAIVSAIYVGFSLLGARLGTSRTS